MWFGNLVTPEEWGYAWISEGFSTLFGPMFIDRYNESLHFVEFNAYQDCQWAKEKDSHINSRPMSIEVYDPTSIKSGMDYIANEKGL